MSNYPPGVSGNEYEIGGPDYEETEHRDCHADVELRVMPRMTYDRLIWLSEQTLATDAMIREVAGALVEDAPEWPVVAMECPFEGDVTVLGYKYVHWWRCPLCQTDHDEELEVD